MLLHIDGFDSYATSSDFSQQYGITYNCGLSTTGGRFGQGCLQITSSFGASLGWAYTAPLTEIWTGFAFTYTNTSQTNSPFFSILSSSGLESQVSYNPTLGTWGFYRGTGTLIGNATYPISYGVYHWIDIHYLIGTTTGTVELWVDGAQVINLTNINNTNYGNTSFNTVQLSCNTGGSSLNAEYDDWYILDTTGSFNNTRSGDSRIETLRPSSDAGPNNGVPSTPGPHYAMVNELQWNSSNSIILGNTLGNAEVFDMTSLSSSPTNIHAVRVLAVAEKTDAGAFIANTIVVSSNVTASGTSTSLTTSFSHITNIFETDPKTNAAWTYGNVNVMGCGFKVF